MQVEVMAELIAAAGATDPARFNAPYDSLQTIHCAVEGMDAKRSAAVSLSSPRSREAVRRRRRAL
jgi:hypothetical protein